MTRVNLNPSTTDNSFFNFLTNKCVIVNDQKSNMVQMKL